MEFLRNLFLGKSTKCNNRIPAKHASLDASVIDNLIDIMGLSSYEDEHIIFDKYTLKDIKAVKEFKENDIHNKLSKIFKMKQVQQLRHKITNETELISLFRSVMRALNVKIKSAGSYDGDEYITRYWIDYN
jgi:hypothetical protein